MKIKLIIVTIMLLATSLFSKAQQYNLTVSVDGFSEDTQCVIALFNQADGFKHFDKSYKKVVLSTNNKQCKHTFKGLEEDEYSVMVCHDKNKNGTLDLNFMGIPKEGVGIYQKTSGIPTFEKTKFELTGDKEVSITIFYR